MIRIFYSRHKQCFAVCTETGVAFFRQLEKITVSGYLRRSIRHNNGTMRMIADEFDFLAETKSGIETCLNKAIAEYPEFFI